MDSANSQRLYDRRTSVLEIIKFTKFEKEGKSRKYKNAQVWCSQDENVTLYFLGILMEIGKI